MIAPILILIILLIILAMLYRKRIKSKKVLIPVIALVIIVSGVLLYFVFLLYRSLYILPYSTTGTVTGSHNLGTISYEVKSCINGVDPYPLENAQNTTTTSRWIDDNNIQINTQVSLLCGGENVTAINTRILNDKLYLSYESEREDEVTRCVCAKELIITISDIEKKEYQVEWESSISR